MSAPDSPNAPKGVFARLLAWVVKPSNPADPAGDAVIAPEMPGEVFFASEPETNAAGAKHDEP